MLSWFLLLTAVGSPALIQEREGGDPRFGEVLDHPDRLAEGWRLIQRLEVPAEQAKGIGQRLGGKVDRLLNAVLSFRGQTVQINRLIARTEADARALEAAMLRLHAGNPTFVLREGATVVEFSRAEPSTILRAHYDLGFRPRQSTYRVRFDAAPLERSDDMSWNLLFNRLRAVDVRTSDPSSTRAVEELAPSFRFGSVLRLRTRGQGDFETIRSIRPSPSASVLESDGEVVALQLADLPRKAGVPYASVELTITSGAFSPTPTARKAGRELLQATRHWPVDDPEIRELARQIVGERKTVRDKTEALLAWLVPGRNLRYDGQVVGSRYGVKKVLAQRFGHCWDFSDVYITLARASGVPSRQVAGWWYERSGHVWAEVLIDDAGWLAVDPTAGLATGSDHVPIVVSELGEMPLVYASDVRLERIAPAGR